MRLLFREPRKGGCQNAFSLLGSLCTAERQECSEIIRGFAAKQVCVQVLSPIPALWLWVNSFNSHLLTAQNHWETLFIYFHWETLMRKMQPAQLLPLTARTLGWAWPLALLLSSWLSLPSSVMDLALLTSSPSPYSALPPPPSSLYVGLKAVQPWGFRINSFLIREALLLWALIA